MGQPMGYPGQMQQQQQYGYPDMEVGQPVAGMPVGPPAGAPAQKPQDDVEVSAPLSKQNQF